jgi:hypothetical protein
MWGGAVGQHSLGQEWGTIFFVKETAGSYAITGKIIGPAVAFVLAAGSYAVTGAAALLLSLYPALAGSYALTGIPTILLHINNSATRVLRHASYVLQQIRSSLPTLTR